MTKTILIKAAFNWGWFTGSDRSSVRYHHDRKRADDVVLKEPRVLHLDLTAARRGLSSTLAGA